MASSTSQNSSGRNSLNLPTVTPSNTSRPRTTTQPSQLFPALALSKGSSSHHSRHPSHTSLNQSYNTSSNSPPEAAIKERARHEFQPFSRATPPRKTPSDPNALIHSPSTDQRRSPTVTARTPAAFLTTGPIASGAGVTSATNEIRRYGRRGSTSISNLLNAPPVGGTTNRVTNAGRSTEDTFAPTALWLEMQRTLADVEMSAMYSSHVFSTEHTRALEDLRAAQLGLASAWAKAEGEEVGDEEFGNAGADRDDGASGGNRDSGGSGDGSGVIGSMKEGGFKSATERGGIAGTNSGRGRKGSIAAQQGGSLEEQAERDIRLARRRREANDRYFAQVNKGVLDVVARLDIVADAMRRVEREGREIWNDESSEASEELGESDDEEGKNEGTSRVKVEERKGRVASLSGTGNMTDASHVTHSPVEIDEKQKSFGKERRPSSTQKQTNNEGKSKNKTT